MGAPKIFWQPINRRTTGEADKMLRQPLLLTAAWRRYTAFTRHIHACRWLSSSSPSSSSSSSDIVAEYQDATSFDIDEMAVRHFGTRPRFRNKSKFKTPRKRASSLFHMLIKEHVEKSINNNAEVLKVPFNVGDAIEITYVDQGGVNNPNTKKDKMRGVVLGKINRGLGSSIYLRDVMFGEPIDRKIQLHSPRLKSLRVLEENFVFKKKKRIKRAKLYYLRDRLPSFTKVTKW